MEIYSLPVNGDYRHTRSLMPLIYNDILIELYQPKKLKTIWTLQMAQDLEALHGLDKQEELIIALQRELENSLNK